VICFELAYDQTIYRSLIGGAQVMMVQSNNATYGGTGQIEQQFAITRARAMESRREIAVATTNSVSGFITRDGAVAIRTQEFTPQSMVVEMPLRSALTPAIRVAPWLERGLALVAVLACLIAVLSGTRRSRAEQKQPNIGSRGAVLRRREGTRFSFPSDDEVGGHKARSARSEHSERSNQTQKEIPVEPTEAANGPASDSRGGPTLGGPRTDPGDHPDLQRVGEHSPHHQPDP
jgi:hypothetical protein